MHSRRRAEGLALGVAIVQGSLMQSGSSTESFEGVPLMQLAAVAAARAEGFSLEEALDTEGLGPAEYRAAELAFKVRLANPLERDRLVAEYKIELMHAENRSVRKVFPLDEDVDAWVRFLRSYAAKSSPVEWLAAIGLSLPDLARLSRAWNHRFESDESLRKRAENAAREKKPYDISSLRISAPKLIASPATRLFAEPTSVETTPEIPEQAVPFAFPVKPASTSPLATTQPAFSVSTEDVLPFVPVSEIPGTTLDSLEPAMDVPPRDALSGTSLSLDIPRGPAMPFATSNRTALIPEKPRAKPTPQELIGTSLALDVHRGPVTPFVAVPDEALIEREPPRVKPVPQELGGTSLAIDIPRGPAMPFASVTESTVIADKPTVKRPPAELAGTSLSLDIPRGPAIPFVAAKDPPPRQTPEASPATPAREALSGTSLAVDIPRSLATPFDTETRRAPLSLPLSLEQHAALTVEIATFPAQAMSILSRYGITPAQKVQLDEHYRRIVSTDSSKQAAWHTAYKAHYATIMKGARR